MIERFEKFSYAISEISKYWHKITADEMEKHGLKGTHSVYLLTLAKYSSGLTSAQICEYCARDKADVSRMMSIMEDKGLVKKEGKGKILYRRVFKLTEKGVRAADEVRERALRAVDIAGKDLTEENRAIFYSSLESILANLKKLSEEGIPE